MPRKLSGDDALAEKEEKELGELVAKKAGAAWRNLYSPYKPRFRWFECVVMLRQRALASVAFVAGDSAAAYTFWSICAACFFAAVVAVGRPYDADRGR